MTGSATATTLAAGGPVSHDTSDEPRKEGSRQQTSVRQRKRRRGGKTSWCHGGGRWGGQERLDKALASFLNWQQSAEERLLSLEEARLERELQAEERREQREERRAEQERQHELRLFSMLTGVLLAVREGTQTTTQSDPATSPLARFSASLITTPAPSAPSSSSQPPPEAPTTEAVFNQETKKSQLRSVKACKMSQNALETLRGEEGPGNSIYLSERGNSIRLHEGILQEGYIQYGMDRHHDTDNPDVREHNVVNTSHRCLSIY